MPQGVISYDITGRRWEEMLLASQCEVRSFINDLKAALEDSVVVRLDNRPENLQTLADLGLWASDIGDVLKKLSESDYYEGPLNDDKGRLIQWWVFGPVVLDCCVYTKVALHSGKVICRSFHKARWPMKYPLKPE